MSQCPGCGAFCFIDMEGNAVVQKDEPAAAAATSEPDPNESIIDIPADVPADESPSHEISNDWQNAGAFGDADAGDANENAAPQDYGANDFKPFDPFAENPVETNEEPASSSDFFEPIDMSPTSNDEREPEREPERKRSNVAPDPSFGPASDPLNLNEFANSEVSSAKDGPLLFRVLISGIDTREIRESIREVLEDPRFAWDSNEIFSKVSKGVLAINGLSPVKASILITRIKRLPIEIRWEQYAIAQGQA